MARRTVTATFAGGMISDEPKPGTARHLENMVPRADGIIPVNECRRMVATATAISTANGVTTASLPYGWTGGGTIHPSIGLVALMDIVKATATATNAEKLAFVSGFGLAGTPHASATRSLVGISDIESASGVGTFRFLDHGGLTPIVEASLPVATGSASIVSAMSGVKLNGHQTFVNTENEVLIVGKGTTTSAERIYRYAGATGNTGLTTSITNGTPAAYGSATGIATVSSTGTATWDNGLIIYGDIATAASATGMYIGLIMGQGMAASAAASAEHATREFMITATGSVTGTGSTASRSIRIDRRVLLSSAVFCRCVIGNTAQLMSSQLSRSTATQPFASPVSAGGFTSGLHNPSGRDGATYHQGRLFLANKSQLSWSGTIDETLQMTATGLFASASASTAVTTSTSATYGVEYKHTSLYSASSYVNVFPHIGGDIVGLVSMAGELLIMKRGGLFRIVGGVSYDGESNSFDLQVISNSIGPEGEFSWTETPAGVVFTWNDGIWLYDGNEVQEISRGTISQSYVENLRMHRMNNGGELSEGVPTKVTSDGRFVYFTPMRYTFSSASTFETAMTTSMHVGFNIHSRHLVLDLGSRKWFYLSNPYMNIPSNVLPARSSRGSKYANYWLGSMRATLFLGSDNMVELIDTHNLLYEHGPSRRAGANFGAWYEYDLVPNTGVAISHPMLGYGKFDAVRPKAALIKHTMAMSGTGYALATGIEFDKVAVVEADHSFVPTSTHAGSASFSGVASGMPEWWQDMTSAATANTIAEQTSSAWGPRDKWSVEGSTSTARAMSVVDRMVLDNSENAMFSPSIYYYDDLYWKEYSSDTAREGERHILHSVALEYDEIENRSDR